ncbi:uncharacterized protein I206_102415 [Kwoniella pini CBS 10737]|uniref:Uncharacterized protein n=1 Tax=Kwoniella pini CBS 10737 TaxID=1296096 RepID=A0A1B9I5E8_9TREE|nr:uncharacterized protein I206_02762 [Kwoniella pini CBS 10737]OCF50706.1 hypothetical protein I206_02762 [Kwoniella pini CBS 10737]
MAGPTLTWIGFNIFRLTALVILCWALAVQFIAIGDDMSEYSKAPSSDNTITNLTGSKLSTSSFTSSNPYASTSVKPSSSSAGKTTEMTASAPIETPFKSNTPEANKFKRDEQNAEEVGQANHGLSSIPRHAGGVTFMIISRLIIVLTISLLTAGQLGWPDMLLHEWVPWLGPQSTPVWLGLVQTIVAVENLRVYAKSTVLLPFWALLVTGLINLSIGAILLYLGRKLPKYPPAPLYFNKSVRILYFYSPPRCYDPVLYPKSIKENDPEIQRQRDLPISNSKLIGLESDNEEEFDEISIHSESLPIHSKYNSNNDHQGRKPFPSASAPGLKPKDNFKDISKGGYPTFSGGGLIDPSRQVPTGFIERTKDGRKIEFINEAAQISDPVNRDHSKPIATGQENQTMKVQKRHELPPRSLSKQRAATVEVPKHLFDSTSSSARNRADDPDTTNGLLRGNTTNVPMVKKDGKHNLLESPELANSLTRKPTLSTMTFGPKLKSPEPTVNDISTIPLEDLMKKSRKKDQQQRQSTSSFASATREMGPRFPFPPSRQTSLRESTKPNYHSEGSEIAYEVEKEKGDEAKNKDDQQVKIEMGSIDAKGPRPPFRAGSKRVKHPQSSDDEEKLSLKDKNNDLDLSIKLKSPKSSRMKTRDSQTTTTPTASKSPKLPEPRQSPRGRSSSTSLTSKSPKPFIASPARSSRKRAITLASTSLGTSPSLDRSSSSKSSRGSRTARGVRFNLSPAKEVDEDEEYMSYSQSASGSESGVEEEEMGEIRELESQSRVVGKEVNTVGTPGQRIQRSESVSLGINGTRPSQARRLDRRNKSKTLSMGGNDIGNRKPQVLGGDYLDGGKEIP